MSTGHVPMRTCLGCGRRKPKQELMRVGIGLEGITANPGGGRGRYLCPEISCLRRSLRRKDIRNLIGGTITGLALEAMARNLLGENALDGAHPERVICGKSSGGSVVG